MLMEAEEFAFDLTPEKIPLTTARKLFRSPKSLVLFGTSCATHAAVCFNALDCEGATIAVIGPLRESVPTGCKCFALFLLIIHMRPPIVRRMNSIDIFGCGSPQTGQRNSK